jgi:hypothetical protein
MGWRAFSEIRTGVPEPHTEVVDLAVDASWRPVRTRISTGSHEILLMLERDRLTGFRDGTRLALPFEPSTHLDYRSPMYNAATANRLEDAADIEVVFLEAVSCEPRIERQRYEFLGSEQVATPAGRFEARRWRYTALSTGWSRDLWVAGDVVVRYEGLYELEWYEAGASGVRPA